MGTILITLVLEVTRWSVGAAVTILAILLTLHVLISSNLTGFFGGISVSWTKFIDTNFVQTSRLLGIPVSVTAGIKNFVFDQ